MRLVSRLNLLLTGRDELTCTTLSFRQVERPLPKVTTNSDGKKEIPPSLPLAEWRTWTFSAYYEECRTAAKAMLALGLQPFDGVNIYGFNSPEWLMVRFSQPPANSSAPPPV